MERVLVVCSAESSQQKLAALIQEAFPARIISAASGGEARRQLTEQEFDLVVINAPLKDEFGNELALTATEKTAASVLLIVKAELFEELSLKLEDYGVLTLCKPLNRQALQQALRISLAMRRRLLGLRKENIKLQQKIEDIRLVDRAKLVLIEHLQMSEAQAHSFIEKQAMDMRVSKREIAEGIIDTYVN